MIPVGGGEMVGRFVGSWRSTGPGSIIGGKILDPYWAMKLIVMVGLFANIGAGTADLIK